MRWRFPALLSLLTNFAWHTQHTYSHTRHPLSLSCPRPQAKQADAAPQDARALSSRSRSPYVPNVFSPSKSYSEALSHTNRLSCFATATASTVRGASSLVQPLAASSLGNNRTSTSGGMTTPASGLRDAESVRRLSPGLHSSSAPPQAYARAPPTNNNNPPTPSSINAAGGYPHTHKQGAGMSTQLTEHHLELMVGRCLLQNLPPIKTTGTKPPKAALQQQQTLNHSSSNLHGLDPYATAATPPQPQQHSLPACSPLSMLLLASETSTPHIGQGSLCLGSWPQLACCPFASESSDEQQQQQAEMQQHQAATVAELLRSTWDKDGPVTDDTSGSEQGTYAASPLSSAGTDVYHSGHQFEAPGTDDCYDGMRHHLQPPPYCPQPAACLPVRKEEAAEDDDDSAGASAAATQQQALEQQRWQRQQQRQQQQQALLLQSLGAAGDDSDDTVSDLGEEDEEEEEEDSLLPAAVGSKRQKRQDKGSRKKGG